MHYDIIIIGAGPGGIFTAYELTQLAPQLKVAVFESGNPLSKRRCPIMGGIICPPVEAAASTAAANSLL